MKCPNCGNINDDDAHFCETCGSQLQGVTSSGISTTNKVLIITLIVLVGVLGIASGYLLTNKNTTVVNQTNINNTTPNQTMPTNSEPLISEEQAINIVDSKITIKAYSTYTATFEDGNPPIWHVTIWDNKSNSTTYGQIIGSADVDARTGVILHTQRFI